MKKLIPLLLLSLLVSSAVLAADAKAPNLQIEVSQRSFFSGKPAQIGLSLYNLKQAQLAVYAVPLQYLAPNAAAVSSDDPKTVGSLPYQLGRLKLTAMTPVKQWTVKAREFELDYWNEEAVKAPLLPPGVYVVSATAGGVSKRTWFAISSRALLAKRSPQDVLVWVVNGASGQPVSGLPVSMFNEKGKSATATTTAEGLVKFPAPPVGTPCWVATQKGDPAFALATSPDHEQPYRAYMYTDRPVYRPGQTVRFHGTVRAADGMKYSLPNPVVETVRAQIKTRGGSTVYDENLPLNEYGSFSGDFALAPEPPLGDYELVVTAGKGALETKFFRSFAVEAYRKPEFTVEVKVDKPHVVGGEEINFTISAKYFFGSPVSGGKVTYNVHFSSAGSTLPRDVLSAAGLGTEATGEIEEGFLGTGRLDKKGELRLSLKTKSLPVDRSVAVAVEVSETALRPRTEYASTYIYASAYNLTLSLDKREYLAGQTANMYVETTDHDGKPVSAAVNLTLIENLVDRENRPYQERTKKTVETNSEGKATVQFPLKRLGYHQITAWAKDAQGNPVYETTNFAVVKKIAARQWPTLDLRTESRDYAPGETAVVDVTTDQLGAWMLVTVEGQRLFSSRVYRVQDHSFKLSFPIAAEWQPNVSIRAAIIRKGELTSANTSLSIPPADKKLTVIVTPNKDKYQPAETASYIITTRDSKGAAVPAEVGLGVADASVYEIRPDSTENAFDAWWGERASRVQTDFSWANMYPGGAFQMMPAPSPAAMEAGKGGTGGAGADEAPRVRNYFTDTAYWGPSVITGADGSAEVKFLVPDNLTTWRATARGMTRITQAGEVRKDVVVTMPLLVRLTLPRFYVQGDEATAAATVHNYTGTERTVKVSLTTEGAQLLEPAEKTITLPNEGILRLTWKIKVTGDKSARFLVSADGGPGGKDAMEATLPVQPDGVKDVVAAAGVTSTTDTATLNLPASAVPGSGSVEVSLSPSLAGPLFDALEYLTTYPYGCAEQTMDSFLPDLIVANTLQKLGAQRPRPKMLDRYVNFGLQKLLRFQHSDGGWHWWEFDESDPFITAYVVYGLKMASDAGYVAATDAMVKGTAYLHDALKNEQQSRDAQAYLLWAAAYAGAWDEDSLATGLKLAQDLFEQRVRLSYFSRASLALALNAMSSNLKAESARGMLQQAATIATELDREAKPQGVGAYWAADGRYRYSWLDNNVEVTSQVLSMLLTLKPDSQNIVPAVRWLMAARDGKHWSSTKDTAAAVLALTKYLQQSKELQPSYTARVFSGDKLIKELKFEPKDAFADAVKVNLSALDLKTGDNAIRIEKTGNGNLYWAARLSYLQPSSQVVPVARGIEVERKYRVPTEDPSAAGTLDPGSVVYVDVTIRTHENLRYALLQEPIPAGCEVIEGEEDRIPEIGLDRREVWDNKLVLYFDYLPRGERTFTYLLRTEAPGSYRILPTSAELMYFPEVRGNGRPVRVRIADVKPE